jgi:hypothetical protein
MISDQEILAPIKPTQPTDRHVVRSIDGPVRLERICNRLPSHWRLEHVTSIGGGMLICVFSRDPSQVKPGDFDYFEQMSEETAKAAAEPVVANVNRERGTGSR